MFRKLLLRSQEEQRIAVGRVFTRPASFSNVPVGHRDGQLWVQGRPASSARTLKVQRFAIGSGRGRPRRVWPMSQSGREQSNAARKPVSAFR
jgi:hypothetical protein